MGKLSFKNILWREGKHYVAQCLNIDVSSFGLSKKEALTNLQEALELYMDGARPEKITMVQKPEIFSSHMSVRHA